MIVIPLNNGQGIEDLLSYQRGLISLLKEVTNSSVGRSVNLDDVASDLYFVLDLLEKVSEGYIEQSQKKAQ